MMEEELRRMLKEQGWNLIKRRRRERDFFYAQRWRMGEIYITSQTKLPAITEEQILAKLNK